MLRSACLCAFLGAHLLWSQSGELRTTLLTSGVQNGTDIQNAGDGSGRLFLVQQNGVIRIWRNGALLPAPFLNISDRITSGGERGLLGLAFPPGYARKGWFIVDYTDRNGDTVIARYRLSSNPDAADPASETVLLSIRQPFSNHNGGQVRFGPDGFLYVGMGDGGSANDPLNNAQNPAVPLGKLLRLDVDSDPSRAVAAPGNPFAGNSGYRSEIWALGLRNPWRFSFDRATGDLWIGDVGQNRYEEIDFQKASSRGGENYGWRVMEGFHCVEAGCDASRFVPPVAEYDHSQGCSVSGGFVYRGSAAASLRGTYLYGDYCSGRIWGVRREGGEWVNRLLAQTSFAISTFGEDEAGELYLADQNGAAIYRLEASTLPAIFPAGVVHAASYSPGITPGSLATVFGAGFAPGGIVSASGFPLPRELGGVQVEVNGAAVPLLAVASVNGVEQVNFQVPWELTGASAQVAIVRGGERGAAVAVPVLAAAPGVFTFDGSRAVAVHWADNTLITAERPLVPGEAFYIYATGLGAVDNTPPTGAATPRAPLARTREEPRVTLGGAPADVLFSGLAPDFAGVYQINLRAPVSFAAGNLELLLSAGGATSPSVTVAARP